MYGNLYGINKRNWALKSDFLQLKICDLYFCGDIDFGYPVDVKPGSFAIRVYMYVLFSLTETGANRFIHVHMEMLQSKMAVWFQSTMDSF